MKWLLWKALEIAELHDLSSVAKPDFICNPDKYFSERLPPIQRHLELSDAEKRESSNCAVHTLIIVVVL